MMCPTAGVGFGASDSPFSHSANECEDSDDLNGVWREENGVEGPLAAPNMAEVSQKLLSSMFCAFVLFLNLMPSLSKRNSSRS